MMIMDAMRVREPAKDKSGQREFLCTFLPSRTVRLHYIVVIAYQITQFTFSIPFLF